MEANPGFVLDRPTYSAREAAKIYSVYVRPVTYQTVLKWCEMWRNTGGKYGLAHLKPMSRYIIGAEDLAKFLVANGATGSQKTHDTADVS